ncbi:MAG: hypothetical protein AAF432_08825 [Planctomycetota bacterium]
MHHFNRFRGRGATVLAIAFTMLFVAGDALGQGRGNRENRGNRNPGGRMFGQFMQPEFLRRDMPMFTDRLDLDATQQLLVETLLDDYQAAFTEGSELTMEQFTDLRPDRNEDSATRDQRREVINEMRAIRREMNELNQALRAGVVQNSESVEQKLEGLRGQMQAAGEKMQELRPPMPEAEELELLQDDARRIANEWKTKRRQLRQQFLDDVFITLTEKQTPQFDDFVRDLRREKSMRNGRLAGESTDLFAILRDIDVESFEGTGIDPLVMQEYELSLDTALKRRETFLEDSRIDMMISMFSRNFEGAIKVATEEAGYRTAVRNTNEQYAQIILDSAVPPVSEAFAAEWRSSAYPRIYRSRGALPAYDAAKALEGLDEDVLSGIIALEEAYMMDRAVRNSQILNATREHEPMEMANRFSRIAEAMREGGGGGRGFWGNRRRGEERPRGEDPVADSYDDRRELDQKYRTLLEQMLTEEQIAALPEVRRERGQRGGWGGRGGGGDDRNDEQARQERRQQMLDRFDTNKDGVLSDGELEAMQQQRRDRGQRDRGNNRGNNRAEPIA